MNNGFLPKKEGNPTFKKTVIFKEKCLKACSGIPGRAFNIYGLLKN
jgi:hypothetical protein